MKLKLIIFDWSGTLSDDRIPVHQANMSILKRFEKKTMTFEEWLSLSMGNAADFLQSRGIDESREKLTELYIQEFEKNIVQFPPKPYDDLLEVIQYLDERFLLSVITSHPRDFFNQEAIRYGSMDYFLQTAAGISDKKEAIDAFRRVQNLSTYSVAYVGDTAYDIQEAKRAAVISVAITHGYHSRERLSKERPDYICDNLIGLKDILLSL